MATPVDPNSPQDWRALVPPTRAQRRALREIVPPEILTQGPSEHEGQVIEVGPLARSIRPPPPSPPSPPISRSTAYRCRN